MQIKLTLATVFLALTSSALAILPPLPVNNGHRLPPWVRPATHGICSPDPRSAFYCGRRPDGGNIKRSAEPVLFRPAVCSSDPRSPLYCRGTRSGYYSKRDAQFRAQVCSSNPDSPFYCKGASSQRRGLGPAPVVWRTGPDGKLFRVPIQWAGINRPGGLSAAGKRDALFRTQVCSPNPYSPHYCRKSSSHKRALTPQVIGWPRVPNGNPIRVPPFTWSGIPRPGRFPLAGAKRSYGGRRGNQAKKPRMMVCSFDKKSPNYCPGLQKDAEKIDDRKGKGRGFFA